MSGYVGDINPIVWLLLGACIQCQRRARLPQWRHRLFYGLMYHYGWKYISTWIEKVFQHVPSASFASRFLASTIVTLRIRIGGWKFKKKTWLWTMETNRMISIVKALITRYSIRRIIWIRCIASYWKRDIFLRFRKESLGLLKKDFRNTLRIFGPLLTGHQGSWCLVYRTSKAMTNRPLCIKRYRV